MLTISKLCSIFIIVKLSIQGNFGMCDHPGFYLRKKLEESDMSQKELSSRIGVSEKLISLVIGGDRNISASLARKLGYVF